MVTKIDRNAPCPCGSGKKYKKCCLPGKQQVTLTREQINIREEAKYIISRAEVYDARIVTLGGLIFFSTDTGDAWLLDPQDNLALCLARNADELPFTIKETPSNFSIEWSSSYYIDGDEFIVTDGLGQIRTTIGYPTKELLNWAGRFSGVPERLYSISSFSAFRKR